MAQYSVTKYFGHFSQIWHIVADSEEEAWNLAERNGTLQYQNVYRKPFKPDEKGDVVDLDKNEETDPSISAEQFYKWMKESADMGMILTPEEYEKCYGLPFHDM